MSWKIDPTPVTVLTGYLDAGKTTLARGRQPPAPPLERGDEERVRRLVFIGHDLPKDIMTDGFLECRALRGVAE